MHALSGHFVIWVSVVAGYQRKGAEKVKAPRSETPLKSVVVMGSDRKLRKFTKFTAITVKLVNCASQKNKDNVMVLVCLK